MPEILYPDHLLIFKDSVYAPVWERIGKWRKYSNTNGELKSISTVALDE
ncbi:MAG: hypothetical protein ABI280_04565 [Ginsengibacter sp.]